MSNPTYRHKRYRPVIGITAVEQYKKPADGKREYLKKISLIIKYNSTAIYSYLYDMLEDRVESQLYEMDYILYLLSEGKKPRPNLYVVKAFSADCIHDEEGLVEEKFFLKFNEAIEQAQTI